MKNANTFSLQLSHHLFKVFSFPDGNKQIKLLLVQKAIGFSLL